MAEVLLLPGNWDDSHSKPPIGTNPIDSASFKDRLFDPANIDQQGVPSIFARAFAFTKALQGLAPEKETQATKQFRVLVQGLFLGIIDIRSHNLQQVGIKLTNTLQGFEPNLQEFHVLVWQGLPVGGIYSKCYVFPGAKFVAASQWRDKPESPSPEAEYIDRHNKVFTNDVSFQALQAEINRQMSLYGNDWVKAMFKLWVDQIRQNVQFPADQATLWFDRLQDVSNGDWVTNVNAPPEALHNYSNVLANIQLDGPAAAVIIPIHRVQAEPLFCEKILGFENIGRYPDFPVKAQHLTLVNQAGSSSELISIEQDGKKRTQPEYKVLFNGWSAPVDWQPLPENNIDNEQGSIMLWPAFKAPGWHVNYVEVLFSQVLHDQHHPNVRLLNENFELLSNVSDKSGVRTDSAVEYVEVTFQGGDQTAGIFKDDRTLLENDNNLCTISLDFGTTNTSVGIRADSGDSYSTFKFEGHAHDLLTTNYWSESKDPVAIDRRANSYFLPIASGEAFASLPSELVFIDRDAKMRGRSNLHRPVVQYTIPHPNFNREAAYEMMVTNFKWPVVDPDYINQRWPLVKAYLRIVLHMVLAKLRDKNLAAQVNIVPTYPLAFGKTGFDEYWELLGRDSVLGLLNEISDETGVALNLAVVNAKQGEASLPVAESYAARASIAWRPVKGTAELVIDIGGGTTDIAVWGNNEEFVESVSYGGNIYLKYLAETFPGMLPDTKEPNERVIALQTMIRRQKEGFSGVLQELHFTQANMVVAQNAIDRFFTGLFVYIKKLLEAAKIKNLHVYPLGNGWRFIDSYFSPNNDIQTYIKNKLKGWEIEADVRMPSDDDLKGAVSIGARSIADTLNYVDPVAAGVNAIVGGNLIVGKNGKVQENLLSWKAAPPKVGAGHPPLVFDYTDFIDDFFQFAGIEVSNAVRVEMAGQLGGVCQNEVYNVNGGEGLQKSITAVFLEKIYPEHIL